MREQEKRVVQLSKVAVCVASMFYGTVTTANPTGADVVNGTASFDQQGSQLNITNSHGTIINWDEFSIAQNEAVRFLQDSANSAVLNRVVGQLPSDILGELSSNGKVFLINPNGLLIGNGARIDTSGFVGSTLDMSNEDFIAGNMRFQGNRGRINNQGYIAAGKNGEVILLAPQIENSGIIEAEDGNILLAAGREVTLHSLDNPGIAFRVSASGDEVLNLGQLLAENGSVKVFADQVMQQGTISATRMTQRADGTIVLEADDFTEVSGSISVKGSGVAGGDIHILGDQVSVKNANIDASGESGGEVLVGGDYQGAGSVKNAQNTDIDASTVINADAGTNGDGGRVIVWSDDTTNTYARITARGGSQSGDGGFVETSGKKTLDFGQPADVSAANGKAGTWLLDPEDIVIDEEKADSISTSLNGGSNVEVKTSDEGDGEGNITVAAAITKTEGDEAVSLTLDAHNRVDVNAPITSTAGPLNVNIKTGRQVANANIETPADVPEETPSDTPDDLISSDEDQQVAEGEGSSEETDLNLLADNTDEGVDQVVEETQEDITDEIVATQETSPESPLDLTAENTDSGIDNQLPESGNTDTEINNFIEEDRQQIVIREDISTGGGSVHIQAGEEGDVLISSEVTTSRPTDSDDQQAGDITVEGNRIALTDDAKLDASGEDAGDILVGGDKQGRNDEVQNADFVYVSENAQIKADGGQNGDGGKVIVFAKDTAIVKGTLTAKGGAESGDGGFIETSGLKNLQVLKAPDASAINGINGEWLIDPYNFTIGVGTDLSLDPIFGGAPWFVHPSASGAFISQTTLRTALLAGDVTVDTTDSGGGAEDGNIIFEANIDFDDADADGTGSLTLRAHNNIYFRGNLIDSDGTHAGNNNDLTDLNLIADSDGDGSGGVIFDGENLVASALGNMIVEVNNDINVSGDSVDITGTSVAGYGGVATDSINLRANNDGTGGGDINFGTMLAPIGNTAADNITIMANAGSVSLQGDTINFYATGGIDIDAGTADNADVFIQAQNGLIFEAGATGDITIDGGSADSASVQINTNGDQDYDANNIILQGGSGSNASVFLSASFANQTFNASNSIQVKGGGGSTAFVGVSASGDQDFITADMLVEGGTGTDATAFIETTLGTQTIDASGKVIVKAGTGVDADAGIDDISGGGLSQIISADGGLDIISTSNAIAGLHSDLNQIITVGTASMHADLNIMGDMSSPAFINSGGDQAITVYGDLIMEYASIESFGGGGGGGNTIDVENIIVNETSSIGYTGSDMTTLTTTGTGSIIDTGASGLFELSGSVWEQEGTVSWISGDIGVFVGDGLYADVNNSGTFYMNSESGSDNPGMGTFSVDMYSGGFNNTGTVEKNSGTGTTIINANFYNDGYLTAGSGTLDFGGNMFSQSSGETSLEGGSLSNTTGFDFTGGQLNGGTSSSIPTGGQIIGNVYLQDTTVNPGHSPGTMTIVGDLDASAGGNTFNMEIAGTATGQYDKIDVLGLVNIPNTNTVNVSFAGYTGPDTLDATDVFPDVIQGGTGSSIMPVVNHPAEEGVSSTDAQVGDNLELTYTRDFFPDEPLEEVITDGMTMEEETAPPAVVEEMMEEVLPDVINLIVTITEEEREALVEAGILSDESNDDDDDDDPDKKNKPKQMCVGT